MGVQDVLVTEGRAHLTAQLSAPTLLTDRDPQRVLGVPGALENREDDNSQHSLECSPLQQDLQAGEWAGLASAAGRSASATIRTQTSPCVRVCIQTVVAHVALWKSLVRGYSPAVTKM